MSKRPKNIGNIKAVAIIILLCIPACLPLLRSDFYHFSDEPNISIIYQLYKAIQSGQIPPRWAPDISYEYGYPLFNFYYVLPFYLGSIFFSLTNSLILSIKLVFLISIPLSAIVMYLWLRQHTNKLLGLIGSIIYVYTPYRAVDLYVRGAIGEVLSFVFFPLIAFFIYKTVESGKIKFVGLLSLSIALLVLTHNLAPLFFLPWVFFYGVVLSFKKFELTKILRLITGFAMGAALSAYFWLPAFAEKGLLFNQTPFDYRDHFPFIKQLIMPFWGYGASVWGPTDQISFQVGLVNITLVLLTSVYLIKSVLARKNIIRPIFFVGSFFLILFLMNIRSTFIWEVSSLSNYIQFPWRLLMITTFLSSSMVIFLNPKKFVWKLLMPLLGFLSIVFTISYFKPSEYYSTNDDYFLRRFFARESTQGKTEEISEEYKNYSEDYLLLPLWVKEKPTSLPYSKFTSDDFEVNSIDEISPVNYQAEVEGDREGIVEFNSYYFPGWEVYVDGVRVESSISKPHGNIGIKLNSGVHSIKVIWQETILKKTSDIISLVSIFIIAFLIIYDLRKRNA